MAATFDPAAFAALLKKAQGNKTQRAFAQEIGMSEWYYNRFLRQNRTTAPSIQSLNRIAEAAKEVSLSELLTACGYDVEVPSATPAEPVEVSKNNTKRYTGMLLSILDDMPFEWTLKKDNPFFPLSVSVKDASVKNLHFIYVEQEDDTTLKRSLTPIYYQLLFLNLSKDDQVYFVTRKEDCFLALTEHKPVNLSLALSSLLLDEKNYEIVKEETLTQYAQLFFKK